MADETADEELPLEAVRAAAKEKDYVEDRFCDRYNTVVDFAKETEDGALVKIQVYPKTRAVTVCVFDTNDDDDDDRSVTDLLATNKKTMYVLGDTDMTRLEEIFSNPNNKSLGYTRRDNIADEWCIPIVPVMECSSCGNASSALLTCSGCKKKRYCGRNCQRTHWRAEHRQECTPPEKHTDCARRWNHVALASGLTSDLEEVKHIVKFCNMLDELLFEPDGPPCLCRCRYGCGAFCAISNMLLQVGREYHDVIGFCGITECIGRMRGELDQVENMQTHFNECANHDDFMLDFRNEMQELKEELIKFRPPIRVELLMWHFERIRCDSQIGMINSNEMPLMTEERTFPVHIAHMDYTRLVYGNAEEIHMCGMHGTFQRIPFPPGDDQSDATEETTPLDEDEEDDDTGDEQEDEQ